MKEIFKNPMFYYIGLPAAVALWPLMLYTVYLPGLSEGFRSDRQQYDKAQQIISEILIVDSQRLEPAGSDETGQFDYAVAVAGSAGACGINPASYKLSSGPIISSGGSKSQGAKVILNDLDIEKFTRFLTSLQLRWAGLQCSRVKLTRKKGSPDSWDIDLDFKYYY